MASIGVLGALSGGAKGFQNFITEEQRMARQERMANLRARNTQESNRINNDQRNQQQLDREQQAQQNRLKLEQTRAKNNRENSKLNQDERNAAPTERMKELDMLTQEVGRDEAVKRLFPGPAKRESDPNKLRMQFAEAERDLFKSGMTEDEVRDIISRQAKAAGIDDYYGTAMRFGSRQEMINAMKAEIPGLEEEVYIQRADMLIQRNPQMIGAQ